MSVAVQFEYMEYLDVLSRNGAPTGKIKSRSKVHHDGDWHRAVHVWIVNGRGELLIQKRSSAIDLFKNLWDISLAGHVRSGETSTEAVRRELKEELGIEVGGGDLKFVETVRSGLTDGENHDRQFSDIYIFRSNISLEEIKKQKKEVADVKFISLVEFKKLLRKKSGQFVPRAEEYEKMFGFFGTDE